MSKAFIDRSQNQSNEHNHSEIPQKKIDPVAQAKWMNSLNVNSGWGVSQMFAQEEEEQIQGKGLAINDDPSLEKEADEMGAKAAQGKMVNVTGSGSGVQRQVQEQDPPFWTWGTGANSFQISNQNEEGSGVLNIPNTYNVFANDAGIINVSLNNNLGISSEHQVSNNIEAKRKYIIDNYNWNAIVGIMKYVSENVDGFTYTNPSNITGTKADNNLIIPDDGILGIVDVQLQNAIENNNGEITAENINSIMGSVDGLPGTSFATIMGEDSKNTLRDEGDNTNIEKADGTDIELPDFESDSEETLYDFMRDITLARNGLWSDEDNIVNLTGLRRELEISETEDHKVQWNDTMAATWIETDADGNEIKHCKNYIATTEPGNRDANRMMTPQTMTVLLGLHKSRQPAGRTISPLIKSSDNNNNTYDFDNDNNAGMNFHPGGIRGYSSSQGGNNLKGGMILTNNALSGLSGGGGAIGAQQFNIHLSLGKLFHILSNYGVDRNKSAYNHLKDLRDSAINLQGQEFNLTPSQQNAINDFSSVEDILSRDEYNDARKKYIKDTVKFDLNKEEDILDGNSLTESAFSTTALDDGSKEVSSNVSGSSHGCQVIYGGSNFYDFWWNTTNKADDSGQRRWYFTLINISNPYNQIETQEGDLNE